MTFCNKCGANLGSTAAFCSVCGAPNLIKIKPQPAKGRIDLSKSIGGTPQSPSPPPQPAPRGPIPSTQDKLEGFWYIIIWGSLLVPCVGGLLIVLLSSILYYIWRQHYPQKAKAINLHGWLAFCVGSFLGILLAIVAPNLLHAPEQSKQRQSVPGISGTNQHKSPIEGSERSTSAIVPNKEWYLRGGMITGGFVSGPDAAIWPKWLRALLVDKTVPGQAEWDTIDLYRVPDASLAETVSRLTANNVFSLNILKQVSNIGYTFNFDQWRRTRAAYEKAYIERNGLPTQEIGLCSRILSQLAQEKEYVTLKNALQKGTFPPGDSSLNQSFIRMLAIQEGAVTPTIAMANDPSIPAAERLLAIMKMKALDPASVDQILSSFRGTSLLDNAVYHAITHKWMALDSPWVQEAVDTAKAASVADQPWFIVRGGERVSDLLWLRVLSALQNNDQDKAVADAQIIHVQYKDSWYYGHATYLLKALGRQPAEGVVWAIDVPGDITVYNAQNVIESMKQGSASWNEPLQERLAERNRYDVIAVFADPQQDAESFLKAAFMAGQEDLVGRYISSTKSCNINNVRYLYPTFAADAVKDLIHQEGMTGVLDVPFLLAVIKNESLFQPDASSPAGAIGLMQLLPSTFSRMMTGQSNIRDPYSNLRAGIRYFRQVHKVANLDEIPAEARYSYYLAGYQAGEGRARDWHLDQEAILNHDTSPISSLMRIESMPIESTRQYVARVLGDRMIYEAILSREIKQYQ